MKCCVQAFCSRTVRAALGEIQRVTERWNDNFSPLNTVKIQQEAECSRETRLTTFSKRTRFLKSAPSGYYLHYRGNLWIDQLYSSYYTPTPQQYHSFRPYIKTMPFSPKTVPHASIFHIKTKAGTHDNNPTALNRTIFTVESTQPVWSIMSSEPRGA